MARRLEDLGREVLGRAAERVRLGPLLDLRGARSASGAPPRRTGAYPLAEGEVDELEVAAAVDEQILRLEVAVDDLEVA